MEGVVNTSGQIYPDHVVGYFRIASPSGRRQLVEPVALGEFLIGSGAQCHLRFGDRKIPVVHTILSVDHDLVRLHSSVADPPILVNGSAETECRLSDGDLLELGDYRLLFRLASAENRITLDEELFLENTLAEQEQRVENVTEAKRLVDRLEEQIQLVEELAHTPDQGVLELLKSVNAAVHGNTQRSQAASSSTNELQQVTALIQRHHDASRIRMESITEVLNNVVAQQKLIADTLQVLSDRVQALDSGNGRQQRRASA
jgi:hypothetical protein